MASIVLGYVPGSGFMPVYSGTPWSGQLTPVGGIQLRAWTSNSGSVYVSLSGGNAFSGQIGTLVGSGGPTITSGGMPLSGGGAMDGFPLAAGDSYYVPREALNNTGSNSGRLSLCVGCDAGCSGQARLFMEAF